MRHAKYLADDVAGLDMSNGLDVLGHGTIIIALVVQMVTILLVDIRDVRLVQLLRVGDVEREEVQPFPVQHVELGGRRLLIQTYQLWTMINIR